jgi:hypothetical protein
MAGIASDSFRDMDAVVEINKIGEVVYPGPDQRFAGSKTGTNRFQVRTINPDLRMTIHARFRGRDSGKTGCFNAGVTVSAVNSHSTNMMSMTELNRLLPRNLCLCDVRGTVDFGSHPGQTCNNEQKSKY